MRGTIPPIRAGKYVNEAPHVVLLGAGASRAAFPQGDKNGRTLPLMNELASTIALDDLLDQPDMGAATANFEAFFDRLSREPERDAIREEVERRVAAYFESLELPDAVTLYDGLILSLRAKDVIATFNWDPLLIQAFRRNLDVEELPRVLFLHGNVGIGACIEHKIKGYRDQLCPICGQPLSQARLLYPVGAKDYTLDPLIANEWDELSRAIGRAFIFTVIGYSAPTTDAAARALLQEAFARNTGGDFNQIELVDVKDSEEVRQAWADFIVRNNVAVWSTADRTTMFRHARRGCDALAWAILQQDPWRERPLPPGLTLEELHEWVDPLVREEQRYASSDEAFVPYRGPSS